MKKTRRKKPATKVTKAKTVTKATKVTTAKKVAKAKPVTKAKTVTTAAKAPRPPANSAPVRRSDFPALCDFLDGYLHQDFVVEHGTVAGAGAAFLRDANAAERKDLVRELRAFMTATAGLPIERVGDLVTHELGGSWLPASREALDALLAVFTAAK